MGSALSHPYLRDCSKANRKMSSCGDKALNVREYARIQTFPDDWEFAGKLTSQYKQIGNAVPVNLGYHVGRCVLASLGCIPITSDMEEMAPIEIGQQQ